MTFSAPKLFCATCGCITRHLLTYTHRPQEHIIEVANCTCEMCGYRHMLAGQTCNDEKFLALLKPNVYYFNKVIEPDPDEAQCEDDVDNDERRLHEMWDDLDEYPDDPDDE